MANFKVIIFFLLVIECFCDMHKKRQPSLCEMVLNISS